MIFLRVHGINIHINCTNTALIQSIEEYYAMFIEETNLENPDIIIDIDRFWYFEKVDQPIVPSPWSIRVGDTIWIHKEKKEYTFQDMEIHAQITWDSAWSMCIRAYLKPLLIRHWVNILLQWTSRIAKYYNRFLIKTCIHDPLFMLLEKQFGIVLLHATAVTDGNKTFVFTGLGWSGKSTTAATFSTQFGYTILADNYALLKGDTLYPFPELPRITKDTERLLWIHLEKKADGIKSYLENDTKDTKESYAIDAICICSYGDVFELNQITDSELSFEQLQSINHYTQEFPEYSNLALLSLLGEYNTGALRADALREICKKNKIYSLQNDKNIVSHIPELIAI